MSKEIHLSQFTSSIDNPRIFPSRMDHNGRPIDINFTVIDNGLYLTEMDMCGIFGVSQPMLTKHMDEVYKEINKGNDITDGYIVTDFSIKRVKTASAKSAILYYPHSIFIKLAFKINTLNAKQIENHVIAVMQELTTNGFVINQHALNTNPLVATQIRKRMAHNYSEERHDMCDMNRTIEYLFYKCHGIYDYTGQVSSQALEYFKRCCHNTAHISTLGISALEVRAYRADPNSPTFGQVNFRGKVTPWLSELNNACNFLTNDELIIRTSVVKNGIHRIVKYIDTNGPVYYRDALKMFTLHSSSEYLRPTSWDWRDYPETALDMVVNAPDRSMLRAEVRRALEIYVGNFYQNGVFVPSTQQSIKEAERILVNEVVGMPTI